MKNPILRYELRHWLRSPLAYFLVIIMVAFAFVSMLGTGGYFDGPMEPSENVSFLNSAYALSGNSFLFAKVPYFLDLVPIEITNTIVIIYYTAFPCESLNI